jgi:allophanate hydrolase
LADHQTTGGYPKIATILDCDLDRLVQLRAGDPVRFQPVSAEVAIGLARAANEERRAYLQSIAAPRGSLTHRLATRNLIGGMTTGREG